MIPIRATLKVTYSPPTIASSDKVSMSFYVSMLRFQDLE